MNTMIEILKIDRVVSFELNKDKDRLYITEECDNYFSSTFDEIMLEKLILELKELQSQMIKE